MHSKGGGISLFGQLFGSKYAADYRKQFGWTQKTGSELNQAAFKWHSGGRKSDFEVKPEGWLSRDEMTSQISDLNKRYDALKIDYDKLSAGPQRDQHGGYGEQTTKVDNMKIAQQQATQAATTTKKKTSSTPQQSQTYTGSASL